MSRHIATVLLLFTVSALCVTPATAVGTCVWYFQNGPREGETFSGTLTSQWPADTCSASFMSYSTIAPTPSGFSFDSIRSPSFHYTPAYGTSSELVRVNLKITCKIFTKVCDSAMVFFSVAPGATKATSTVLTTATTTTSTTTTAAPTTTFAPATSTSAGVDTTTSVDTSSSAPTISPLSTEATTTSEITTPTADITNTTVVTTETTTQTTTTLEPTVPPMGGLCPSPNGPTISTTVGNSVTIDLGLTNANPNDNVLAITTCPKQLTVGLLPETATITANTQTPNIDASRLWTTGSIGGITNIIFDAKGANAIEGIFSIRYIVSCGRGQLCNATQTVVVASNLTTPPITTVKACNQVYGYTGYYGVLSTFSVAGIEGETQCPTDTPLRTVVGITVPKISSSNFSFNASTATFQYRAPTTSTVDTFNMGVQCNGQLYCQATIYIVTESDTVYVPTTSTATTEPPITLPACPNVYQYPVTVPDVSSLATLSLKNVVGVKQCDTYSYFKVLSKPANGGTVLVYDNTSGLITYLTPSTFAVTLDHFDISIGCANAVGGPWECQGSAFILLSKGTPAPTQPTTTPAPTGMQQITEQLVCGGTCDADDVLKVSQGLPNVFDIDNTLGPRAGWSRKDNVAIGSVQYRITREGTLKVSVFGKIGSMMSGRFPTFSPVSPDQYYTSATVPAKSHSAVAFNATCLDQQSRYGIAEELWEWTNITNYEGHIIGNYADSDNIYQKFGGKHSQCDTFKANSCKYAPTLTPATVADVFTGDYSLRNLKRLTPPGVDWSSYIRWQITILGCDTMWETELTPLQVRSLATTNEDGSKTRFFNRISDRTFTTNVYTQAVKPKRWHPPFTGVDVITGQNPIALSVGSSFEVDTVEASYDAGIVSAVRAALSATSATVKAAVTTPTTAVVTTSITSTATAVASVVTAGHTFVGQAADNQSTAVSLIVPRDSNATSPLEVLTSVAATTAVATIVTTSATTVPPTTTLPPPTFAASPNVTIATDVQYFSGTNADLERTYGYNVILYPESIDGSAVDFKNLFVAGVNVLSTDFSAPLKTNCPLCAGTAGACTANLSKINSHIFGSGDFFPSNCVSGSSDTSIITITPGPIATTTCAEINATSPAGKLSNLVAGVSATSCPKTYFNVTLRGVVRGKSSSREAGQSEGTIVVRVSLSNGQVFQTTLNQHVFFSQVAHSPSELVTTTACRSTAYFPVKDPFGGSTSTNRLVMKASTEHTIPATTLRTIAPPTAAMLAEAAANANGAYNNTDVPVLMADKAGDQLCANDNNPILSPTDWYFFQIETNNTLDHLILSVAADEVIPSTQQRNQQLSFVLATGAASSWVPSNGEYNWKRYAAMLNVRVFETTVNPATNTRVHSVGFIPGTLLQPSSSSQVPFTLEATMLEADGTQMYVRSTIVVSSHMSAAARKDTNIDSDPYGLGTVESYIDTVEENSSMFMIMMVVFGCAAAVCLVGIYYNDVAKNVILDQHAMVMELITGKKPRFQEEREKEMAAHHEWTSPTTGGADKTTRDLSTIIGRDLPPARPAEIRLASSSPTVPRTTVATNRLTRGNLQVQNEPARINDLEVEDEPKRRHNSEEA